MATVEVLMAPTPMLHWFAEIVPELLMPPLKLEKIRRRCCSRRRQICGGKSSRNRAAVDDAAQQKSRRRTPYW